jgi:signal peptidase I
VVDKHLYINGKAVDDSSYSIHGDPLVYSDLSVSEQGRRRDNFGPEQVPEGHYFCMGDNRDFSYDSRFWGTLPRHLVKGRALFIYWSNGGETSDGRWKGMADQIRQIAKTAAGFFTNTRWGRTFRLIR